MKKGTRNLILIITGLIIAFIYYYITLPAINIHSTGFWGFAIIAVAILTLLLAGKRIQTLDDIRESKGLRRGLVLMALIGIVFLIGTLLSSPIINASKYQQLLAVQDGEFETDIEELSFDQIPLLDRDSAQILGNRKMGSMVDMVSQFEVNDLYTQINYNDKPVRVSPLEYADPIKWLTNRSEGIPAYIMIDMATQDTELVKLDEGIRYSEAEYFNRNIYRHLRFRYPTYIFDELNFELDDDGVPYWVCPVKKFNIGLFGGTTIGKVVLCNAITGETEVYDVDDVPNWIDRVYSAELLVELYNYYGSLKHGWLNSVFGQRDCIMGTDGYNYLAIDDDVWVYTGTTSVSGDQSNVGFVLMNQRTMETNYYEIEGAIESSAMASAEGQVQHLGYGATFPLLLNISDEPTYFLALKDDAGLVKKYAMVNVQKYQLVATGDTVAECETEYQTLLVKNDIIEEPEGFAEIIDDDDDGGENEVAEEVVEEAPELDTKEVTGVIEEIVIAVVDGNSHYYIVLEDADEIYDVNVAELLEVIRFEEGDEITMEYAEDEPAYNVVDIK